MGDSVGLDFANYPAGTTTGFTEEVPFGAATTHFTMLVEVDPSADLLRVVVGNGPPHDTAPEELSAMLYDLAEVVANLRENTDYTTAVADLTN